MLTPKQIAVLEAALARDRAARAAKDRWARPPQLPWDEPLSDGREAVCYDGVWYAWPAGWSPPQPLTADVAALMDVLDDEALERAGLSAGLAPAVGGATRQASAAQMARADGEGALAEAIERQIPHTFRRLLGGEGDEG